MKLLRGLGKPARAAALVVLCVTGADPQIAITVAATHAVYSLLMSTSPMDTRSADEDVCHWQKDRSTVKLNTRRLS